MFKMFLYLILSPAILILILIRHTVNSRWRKNMKIGDKCYAEKIKDKVTIQFISHTGELVKVFEVKGWYKPDQLYKI